MDIYDMNVIGILIMTIYCYMIVPVSLRLSNGKGYEKKVANKIAIINSIVLFIVFTAINVVINPKSGGSSAAPAFLYYCINVFILKSKKTNSKSIIPFIAISIISCIISWFYGALVFGTGAIISSLIALIRLEYKKWQKITLYITTFIGSFCMSSYLFELINGFGEPMAWGILFAILMFLIIKYIILKDYSKKIKKIEEELSLVCDQCGAFVKETDAKCPNCGIDFEEDEKPRRKNSKSDFDEKYDSLNKLKELYDNKIITKKEFDEEKKKILNN